MSGEPRLDGVRAVVTGGSRGVGRAVAEALAAEGARVVASGRTAASLESVSRAPAGPGEIVPAVLELEEPASVADFARAAVRALGRVDLLVNGAGVLGARGPLARADMDELELTLRVGVAGTLRLTTALLPHMSPGGAIVNVTSGAAARPGWGGYGIAKAALDAATRMLRAELAPEGIRVVGVNPGGVRTAMRAAAYPDEDPATVPHPRAVTPVFVAIAEGADPGVRVEAQQWTP